MNLTPEQFAATRKALRAYDPKGTENLTDEHLDGMALSVALAIVTSAPDQGSGGVKKPRTVDEMREAMKKATMDAALQSLRPGESVRVHKDKNGEFFINEGQPAA